jgi:hypothetical protein
MMSMGGVTACGMPRGVGASETPQFPATTVVTPWLTLGAMSGASSSSRSSWVWASMKPGAAMRPEASTGRRPVRGDLAHALDRSVAHADVGGKRAARVPSMTVAFRMTKS